MTSHVVIVDLDGTLCNSGHREHLARAKEWDAFHALLGQDEPWPDVRRMVEYLAAVGDTYLVALTGRSERYRMMTLQWLDKHDLHFDNLLMRPDNDWRPDHELKIEMAAHIFAPEEIWFILEDREKVVEAWRNAGYACWQTRPGGY